MAPLYLTLSNNKQYLIIPDTLAHLDGHTVITYTYSIFINNQPHKSHPELSKEQFLHLQKNDDPDYCGYITFEKPDSLFTYTADGHHELGSDEVGEIIEDLSHIRNYGSWKVNKNQ